VYTTDEDKLIAHGSFLVSAIALSTPISLPSETPTVFPTLDQYLPTEETSTAFPTLDQYLPTEETPTTLPTLNEFIPPTQNELTQTSTSTPNAGNSTP
jgi:hypothetical protein